MTINPVNGQIMADINEALQAIVDLKGEPIKFTRDENIKDDIVYTGEGSDGKTYSIKLERKTVIISLYDTPKPSPLQKAPTATTTNKKVDDNKEKEKDKPTTSLNKSVFEVKEKDKDSKDKVKSDKKENKK